MQLDKLMRYAVFAEATGRPSDHTGETNTLHVPQMPWKTGASRASAHLRAGQRGADRRPSDSIGASNQEVESAASNAGQRHEPISI